MKDVTENWITSSRIIIGLVAIMWMIEAINATLGHAFNVFGIYPRVVQTPVPVMVT